MALDPSSMIAKFTQLSKGLLGDVSTGANAAKEWAKIYDEYAQGAMHVVSGAIPGPPGVPGVPASSKTALEGMLVPAFSAPGTSASAAAAIANGVTSYWFAPPVPFNAGPTVVGAVTAVGGTAAAIPALTTLLSVPNTSESFASGLAGILDALSRTVIVTVQPPPPAPPLVGPIA